MPHAKINTPGRLNGHQPPVTLTPTFPRLTWQQRIMCKHLFKIPIYQEVRHGDDLHVWLVGHVCAHCGRKLRYPRRVSLFPALFCLGLAFLLLAAWLLYMW